MAGEPGPRSYRVAAVALMTEHPMGQAHALDDNDRTLCGLTVPPLQLAWRVGPWPPARADLCMVCRLAAADDPDDL